MKFGLRFWAWIFWARNNENHRPECDEKSASEISCQISRCHVSKSASRGVPKIRVFGGENPRKIRVGQESVGLNDWGAWDEPLCLKRRIEEMLCFGFLMRKCPRILSNPRACCDNVAVSCCCEHGSSAFPVQNAEVVAVTWRTLRRPRKRRHQIRDPPDPNRRGRKQIWALAIGPS